MSREFRPHILKNAATSQKDEPDCHRFDVLVSEEDPDTFILYEEYTDVAAFEFHHNTTHFKAFQQAVDTMVAERAITRCTRLS